MQSSADTTSFLNQGEAIDIIGEKVPVPIIDMVWEIRTNKVVYL